EMPNTNPQTTTQEELQKKYDRASDCSPANYSFYMGATNDNIEEVLKTDPEKVCGVKVFMGSSTGNMLVDDAKTLENIFSRSPMLIATHCEKEEIIRRNEEAFRAKYGEDMGIERHPEIRDVEACLASSTLAVGLARKHGTRLHVLHLTTEEELSLFDSDIPLEQKRVTGEVCVHHLWFSKDDYAEKGTYIKCNPAVKEERHRLALLEAIKNGTLDIIATDHAPHTKEEKNNNYWSAPSGLPLVQHSLQAMLEFVVKGEVSMEWLVEKMCHAPAIGYKVKERGYLREGYWADLTLVDPNKAYTVNEENILSKCKWSPFEGYTFANSVDKTIVSGQLAYDQGNFYEVHGKRLDFHKER
ncbi:MAG: dihydroorotase, partial [Lentisphaeraceae bacterium]|nr:dihydroorotase [Lentisphaeraceae bacterium]